MKAIATALFVIWYSYIKVSPELKLKKQIESGKTFNYLALGDSYTKGESVPLNKSFPYQLIDALKASSTIKQSSIKIIAQTGWTTTNLKNAIAEDPDASTYDLVTLLIGVNNQYQGKPISLYETEFDDLLETAIKKAGGDRNKVAVISIPDYGFAPFGKDNQSEISKGIDMYNAINKRITLKKGITYFDITPITRKGLTQPELVAADGLHPSPTMYKAWIDLMIGEVKKIIKN
jgi:lysophospholipase L1-like esterase